MPHTPVATCPGCSLPVSSAFVGPMMSAAGAAFPVAQGPNNPNSQTSSLPRLDYVLTAAARAALATRRRGAQMSPETRAKIAATASRNRAARAAMIQQSLRVTKREQEGGGESESEGKSSDGAELGASPSDSPPNSGGGRRMSDERRRRISAAMKGRALSAEHRRKLSVRFTGERNPMYGRKVSATTRAKISSGVVASRAAKKAESESGSGEGVSKGAVDKSLPISPELQEKVLRSRLISSLSARKRTDQELDEEAALDDLLDRVAAGKLPPAAVKRMRHDARDKAAKAESADAKPSVFVSAADAASVEPLEQERGKILKAKPDTSRKPKALCPAAVAAPRPMHAKTGRKPSKKKAALRRGTHAESMECSSCLGSGSVVCVQCVGQVGVASKHCTVCAGAAVTFCPNCLGAGELQASASV